MVERDLQNERRLSEENGEGESVRDGSGKEREKVKRREEVDGHIFTYIPSDQKNINSWSVLW